MFISLQVQTELMHMGMASRKRKPPLKEDAVPSILSYVPEKKVRQASIDRANLAIRTGTPSAIAKT